MIWLVIGVVAAAALGAATLAAVVLPALTYLCAPSWAPVERTYRCAACPAAYAHPEALAWHVAGQHPAQERLVVLAEAEAPPPDRTCLHVHAVGSRTCARCGEVLSVASLGVEL